MSANVKPLWFQWEKKIMMQKGEKKKEKNVFTVIIGIISKSQYPQHNHNKIFFFFFLPYHATLPSHNWNLILQIV